jgi:AraC-like DNA-binding protein
LHRTVEELLAVSCPQAHEGSAEEIARKAHEYLVTHLSERVTIDTLSRKFAINPTTLKQAFKEVYGDAIASHVTSHRMKKAQKLLQTTSAPVSYIAKEVGYESQSRFTAAYRRHYGYTPTAERERR